MVIRTQIFVVPIVREFISLNISHATILVSGMFVIRRKRTHPKDSGSLSATTSY